MNNKSGYIYSISSPSLPGIQKIGMTERNPQQRLKEANSNTWNHTSSTFTIEFSKYVENVREAEKTIHCVLEKKRVKKGREFFKVDLKEVEELFDSINGEYNIKYGESYEEFHYPFDVMNRFVIFNIRKLDTYFKIGQKIYFHTQYISYNSLSAENNDSVNNTNYVESNTDYVEKNTDYGIYKGNNKILYNDALMSLKDFYKTSYSIEPKQGFILTYTDNHKSAMLYEETLEKYGGKRKSGRELTKFCRENNVRWLEAEETIKENADIAYCYAKYVLKGRWKEGEDVIMRSPYYRCQYEKNILCII